MKNIKMLYLAHYAPSYTNEPIPSDIEDRIYAEYHHRVYQILLSNFPLLVSYNNPSIMLQSELDADYIFSLYNRMPFRNSEVFVSSVAEYHNIPYLGATPNIRAIAEDKQLAKMLAKHAGVPTPKWKTYNIEAKMQQPDFKGPYFVKPRFGASSKFIDENSICYSWDDAQSRIRFLHNKSLDAILEQYITGVYYTSPVLNNFQSPFFLPSIREYSVRKGNVVTYKQKRKIDTGLYRTINEDSTLEKQLNHFSKKLYELIQPLDYTRFDFIVDNNSGIPYFIEFNVCCNLGEQSSIKQSATHIGIDYEDLLLNIVYSSLYRNNLIQNTFGKNF
ncbi:hypothetical protein [Desulfuribacillus alkaliarsenatis]|uniref:ATP-grasp domain-containing protein n=1 Tax=Desulfuribacillus alkaliarsenatis TaxID=766136 RepID=A0A1E5G1Y9_9FIRM|nr:hypothetical protein [Desulfuribacillus alkaliarsenatis]OEF96842.1 hypothetical protein BHF68_07220 [Desulfuribacillus alkaliarsenatis]